MMSSPNAVGPFWCKIKFHQGLSAADMAQVSGGRHSCICQEKKRENTIVKWVKPRYCTTESAPPPTAKGAPIHDVQKCFGFLPISPLCLQNLCTVWGYRMSNRKWNNTVQPIQSIFHFLCDIICPHTVLFVHKFGVFFATSPPPLRTSCMEAPKGSIAILPPPRVPVRGKIALRVGAPLGIVLNPPSERDRSITVLFHFLQGRN